MAATVSVVAAAAAQVGGGAKSNGVAVGNGYGGPPVNGKAGKEEDAAAAEAAPDTAEEETQKEVDITINNVVSSFSVKCHLNLRDIAQRGANVEYRRENGMATMKLRKPWTTASMWSSGKITCTGASSEPEAHCAARRYSRILQKLGFNIKFRNFRVVNVLGTCIMPFGIKITQFSQLHREAASYEPELHPGVTYKIKEPKATLKIFSTGSITVTARSVAIVQMAIEHIYPLVEAFQKPKTKADIKKKPTPDSQRNSQGVKRAAPPSSSAPSSSSCAPRKRRGDGGPAPSAGRPSRRGAGSDEGDVDDDLEQPAESDESDESSD